MTAISELLTASASAMTGMERVPAVQGGNPVNVPLFAVGNVPRGAVLALGRPYLADTAATTDADPGAGNVRWNHATQTSASVIFIDDVDTDAADLAAVLASLQVGGYLYLQGKDIAGAANWQKWQVTSLTDAAGYTKVGVSLSASAGSFADDEELLLSAQQPSSTGSSAGRHAVYIAAAAMSPSASGGCAALSTIASAANQPDIQTLDFDATTQEYAQFAIRMPKSWNEGTVTFAPVWSHASTTTNFGVVWDLQAVAISNDDTILTSFGTAQTSTDTGGTTNDVYVGPEASAITIAGTPAAEDLVCFRLSRVTGNGSDTLSVDARLHGITLYITTDADNDA